MHKKGGYIFNQIWHIGRAGHSSLLGHQPVGPSAIAVKGDTNDKEGKTVPFETPREVTIPEIKELVQQFKTAAQNAIAAGFDGVEV